MIDRTHIGNIDWVLIGLLLINSFIGVAVIYSASHYLPDNYHLRQLFWVAVSLVAFFVFLSVDYNKLVNYSFPVYGVCLLVLLWTLVFGSLISGARSWIRLPFIQIQPSEITRIAVILVLAQLFSKFKRTSLNLGKIFVGGTVLLIPVVLVGLQPDLGTALSYVPILLGAWILAGITKRTVILFLILSFLVGFTGWNVFLKDYQKDRLTTMLFPDRDPLGSGYQITQSKIAIGSGGFFGKGYKKGTQSQLRFLPARHTDFIFSVIGEEMGFLGVGIVFLFYFLLLFRLFQSAFKSRDRTGVYIVFMVAIWISSQFFISVMMTVGLFPIAGIPLPLLSYGGSSLLTTYIAASLVVNVKMRRFVNV